MDAKLGQDSYRLWEQFGELIRDGMRDGFRGEFDIWNERYAAYAQFGVVMGGFSRDLGAKLMRALAASQPAPALNGGAIAQFIGTEFTDAQIAALNRHTEFLRPSTEAMWWLSDIVDELARPIASFMGSPWRILCARAWRMRDRSQNEGANHWHRDGLPFPIVKIMIFPHAVDAMRGTTEIRFPDGQTMAIEQDGPCWVLLKSSEVEHRGVPPSLDDNARYSIELTIVPSPRFDLVPIFAGSNVRQPVYP